MSEGSIVGGFQLLLLCARNNDDSDELKSLLDDDIKRIDPDEKLFTQNLQVIIPF